MEGKEQLNISQKKCQQTLSNDKTRVIKDNNRPIVKNEQLPPSRRWSLISLPPPPLRVGYTSCLAFKESKEKEKLHSGETWQTPPQPHDESSHPQ